MRARALSIAGGVAGPAAFVAAWAVGGAVADGYSPVEDPISRLAAVDAATRPLMTAGFLGFSVGVGAFAAVALRASSPGVAWVAAIGSSLATAAVAALPLDAGVDGLHGLAAGTGYLALVAVPALATPGLRRGGRPIEAGVALGVAGVAAVALLGSVVVDGSTGLLQRLGLTILDAWVVVTAARLGTLER